MQKSESSSSSESTLTSKPTHRIPKYICSKCNAEFDNSYALSGHQNAHRVTRSSASKKRVDAILELLRSRRALASRAHDWQWRPPPPPTAAAAAVKLGPSVGNGFVPMHPQPQGLLKVKPRVNPGSSRHESKSTMAREIIITIHDSDSDSETTITDPIAPAPRKNDDSVVEVSSSERNGDQLFEHMVNKNEDLDLELRLGFEV